MVPFVRLIFHYPGGEDNPNGARCRPSYSNIVLRTGLFRVVITLVYLHHYQPAVSTPRHVYMPKHSVNLPVISRISWRYLQTIMVSQATADIYNRRCHTSSSSTVTLPS